MTAGIKNAVPPRRNAPRKCKQPRSDAVVSKRKKPKLTTTTDNAKTYFSTIPQDALENVLRFTSEKPHAAKWKAFVKPSTALLVLNSRCELAACALRLFHSLQGVVRPERNGIAVPGPGINQVEDLMSALSAGLTELDINGYLLRGHNNRDFPVALTKSLTSHCPNLKHLSLRSWNFTPRYTLDQILSVRSGKLESLEIEADMRSFDINAIANHCKGLKRLLLHFEHLTASLDPVWKTVGPSLEELSLGQRYFWLRTNPQFMGCAAIAQHCRSIRKLAFEGFRSMHGHDVIQNLVTGYGKQLESLTFDNTKLPLKLLAMITFACENVAITTDAGSSLLGLSTLGARASHVSISTPYVHRDNSETYELLSRNCTNIVSLDLAVHGHFMSHDYFNALFTFPKNMLSKFRGTYITEDLGALGVLARRVSTLQSVVLRKSWLSFVDLAALIAANQGLCKVELYNLQNRRMCRCDGSDLAPGAHWGTVVATCLESPCLRELECSCRYVLLTDKVSEFVEACNPARHRGVSIRICGIQYL